ncbi:MAG: hypothetical protein AAGD00_01105 [Planctomycetota bacterium]
MSGTHLILNIEGQNAIATLVRTSGSSPAAQTIGSVTNALHAPRSDWRAIAEQVNARTLVSLVVPTEWCASREAPIEPRDWARSENAIRELVDSTFPFSSSEAHVSLIVLDAHTTSPRTLIVGAARARIEPWLDAIPTNLAAGAIRAVPEAAGLLGLGAQHDDACVIVDPNPAVGASMHRFERGSLVSVGEPFDSDEVEDVRALGGRVMVLERGVEVPIAGETVSRVSFAAGTAMEPLAAPGAVRPFVGERSRQARPMLVPAGMLAAAIALVIAGVWYESQRYSGALERVASRRAALADSVADVTAERDAALRARDTLEGEVAPTIDGWRPILPTLREALDALPDDGFAYRVRLDARRVEMSGEAPRAAEVLERLDASNAFTSAEQTQPISTVPIRELETFAVRAERTEATP